jgi:hypothetical protein
MLRAVAAKFSNGESRYETIYVISSSDSVLVLERTKSCPLKERAAATNAANTDGFVEYSPFRVFRDGEGTLLFKLNQNQNSSRHLGAAYYFAVFDQKKKGRLD